jgi:Tol biopolymer transport system component
VEPDGSHVVRLTTNDVPQDVYPAWSPDGRKIAWSSAGEIWVMNADGSGKTRLTNNSVADWQPAWSPDGTKIAFERQLQGVWVMNADGSDETQIFGGASPAWSPDGGRIALTIDVGQSYEIYVVETDGSNPVRLTNNSTFDGYPNWSPDAQKIAFSTFTEILVMNPDGSDQTNLTNHPAFDDEPAWSPDGSRIAFTRLTPVGYAVFAMDADGSNQTQITGVPETFNFEPDWQPLVNRPPSCSDVAAMPSTLAPVDRTLRLVSLHGASDPDGDMVALTATGVTQDEPLTGGEDKTSPDAFSRQLSPDPIVTGRLDNDPNEVYLRAERRNRGDGRVYRISFTASDGRGGSCSGAATVSVRRHTERPAVDSAPPSYDSFGG